MTRILMVLLLLFSVVAAGANAPVPPELEGAKLYRMTVQGMACPFCAYSVERRLNAIEGVQYVDVDLKTGTVRVGVAEGIELSEQQMKRLYRDAGFKLRSMEEAPLDLDHLRRP